MEKHNAVVCVQGEDKTLIYEPIFSESKVKTKSCYKLLLQLEGSCPGPARAPSQPPEQKKRVSFQCNGEGTATTLF